MHQEIAQEIRDLTKKLEGARVVIDNLDAVDAHELQKAACRLMEAADSVVCRIGLRLIDLSIFGDASTETQSTTELSNIEANN
jgi:hypothetical protein